MKSIYPKKKKRKLYDTKNIRSVVPLGREELVIMGKCMRGLSRDVNVLTLTGRSLGYTDLGSYQNSKNNHLKRKNKCIQKRTSIDRWKEG